MSPLLARRVLAPGVAIAIGVTSAASGRAQPAPHLAHDPRAAADLSVADGRLSIRLRATTGDLTAAQLLGERDRATMSRQLTTDGEEWWRGTLPERTRRYRLRVRTARGDTVLGPFTVPAAPFRAVPWVSQAVGYQIFPDRFQNGDRANDSLALAADQHRLMPHWETPVLLPWQGAPVTEQLCCHAYFGGDLAGIAQRLDSLAALGVTLLYLNPLFRAGSAHGYDTYDYRDIAPGFGTKAALADVIRRAHARGMRVLFDFVPNHVGLGYPRFRDAVARGPASPWWSWFTFTAPPGRIEIGNPAHYATFAGSGAMPKLNTSNPAVQRELLAVAREWLKFGFDGVRVDVPNELVNAASFARALRTTAKRVRPDAYLVGEIWERAPQWVQGDQFDALMNYAVGRDIVAPFARGTLAADSSAAQLARLFAAYPEAATAMAFNVIATHDTPRLLTLLGTGGIDRAATPEQRARQQLAAAMLYALPGVPLTFQGDECAFTGAMNENRYPVQWTRCDTAMRAHYTRLARLRRTIPALRSAPLRLPHAHGTILAWYRGDPGVGEVLALFNPSDTTARYPLPAGTWRDAVTSTSLTDATELSPRSWRYLERRPR